MGKLKGMLPTVWYEQGVDDGDLEPPGDGDGDAAERSDELVHRAVKQRDCRLFGITKGDRHCQVCYDLAPTPPGAVRGADRFAWKLKHCAYKDVKKDKNCNKRMCPKCYADCWNHT